MKNIFIALLENICQYLRTNAESAEILYNVDMQDVGSGRNLFNKYSILRRIVGGIIIVKLNI